ncbi:MAG: 16S rRNA (cytosine(1402)-N(4))-methyltransferase RsmH [Bacteroidales bacterium]|nr:16S rRNA (cytosine(1402)-N(4))-methyltransferase RsmH [Bacteroidales bacterium]
MEYHKPVLLSETINALSIDPSGTYVDATFGGGGHSREILGRLTKGRLIGMDCDFAASGNIPENKRFLFIHGNFRFIKNYLRYYGISNVDGILADLGMSSHHIDNAYRGFSFRHDGNLDMRMNAYSSFTAEKLINEYSVNNLLKIFRTYGELANGYKLARSIVKYRMNRRISRISQFLDAISGCIPARGKNKYLAKVFQSLRIEVNKEIINLKELLLQSIGLLKTGGRLVIISYHSVEDRMVKNFIRCGNPDGILRKDIYGNYKIIFKSINKKPIVPAEAELKTNSRARSAKLRIAEKVCS